MHTTYDTIHAIVHTHDNNKDFLITFMYGVHDVIANQSQWQYLLDMHTSVDLPWVVLSDLNFMMHDSETHSNGNSHPHHARHIRNFVQQIGLIDLGYSAANTTWSNHRTGDEHVSVKLERELGFSPLYSRDYQVRSLQRIYSQEKLAACVNRVPDNEFDLSKCSRCEEALQNCKS
ncbi:hypothetical protein MKW98_030772 [Papaver atlanticum]|uniref:Endonuclease/exonuclease/phosphatase domain-containing protein n=1 Tax=Papaver atlanticum TaxID=357466 RepID=A0AAD4S0I6_9MAGN|nr:hypothetical protein MKW98_030772 [Papaver atlanticum]